MRLLMFTISPPISSLLILDSLLFSSTFCQIPLSFFASQIPFLPLFSASVSFFFSSLLAPTFVCAVLAATEHRCLCFGQRCSLSASPELIALSDDSHPVRPIVLVEYALNASAICSADWHLLCHLLIFVCWVFLMLKPLGFFFSSSPTQMTVFISLSDCSLGVRLTDIFHLNT